MKPARRPSTALLHRLSLTEMVDGQAVVLLDGQPIGVIARERPGFYGCYTGERGLGGGKSISNALRSFAVNYVVGTGA